MVVHLKPPTRSGTREGGESVDRSRADEVRTVDWFGGGLELRPAGSGPKRDLRLERGEGPWEGIMRHGLGPVGTAGLMLCRCGSLDLMTW